MPINDPKLRQQYIAAIALNNTKIEKLRQQNDLAHAKESCLAFIKAYVESYFESDAVVVKVIVETPEISDDTRKLIMSTLSSQ